MLYPDTVESEVLVHKPWFIALMFAVVLVLFLAFNMTGTVMGELMRPVIGAPAASGFHGRFAIAFVIALVFSINVVLIGFASLKVQIAVVWLELLLLFLAFFKTFNLSLPFIAEKLPFLITQGVVTTLYVSAISIIIASVIAVLERFRLRDRELLHILLPRPAAPDAGLPDLSRPATARLHH